MGALNGIVGARRALSGTFLVHGSMTAGDLLALVTVSAKPLPVWTLDNILLHKQPLLQLLKAPNVLQSSSKIPASPRKVPT